MFIEVAAEANPLTSGILYNVLRSASSANPQQVLTGTQQLQQWETEKSFHKLLQDVYLDKSAPLEIRYLAIIKLKNGIDKYWRKYAADAVPKDEKNEIRRRLLRAGVEEADFRLALQNALVTAKIARHDHPLDWPDLFTELTDLLQRTAESTNPLHVSRSMLMLLHIIKELATGRLQRTRSHLQSAAPSVFKILVSIYVSRIETWLRFLKEGGIDEGGAIESIEQSLLAIKVLRRLAIYGFEFPNRSSDVTELWNLIRSHFNELASLVSRHGSELAEPVRDLVEKHLFQFSKLHLEMARTRPLAFALLPESVTLARSYWSIVVEFSNTLSTRGVSLAAAEDADTSDDEKPLIERLSLKGLTIIRECIRMVFKPHQTFKFRHAEEKEETKTTTELIQTQLLTDDFVREMVNVIVEKFFLLRQEDLVEWKDDPEDWERKAENEDENWEYAVRPCTERLFLDVVTHYREMLTPALVSLFSSLMTLNPNVLARDASYTALGQAAPIMHKDIPFDNLVQQILVQEVQIQNADYSILRRRIAILIRQWITVKMSDEARVTSYQIFRHMLNPSDPLNDLVVRITAGKCLKTVVDEWDFKAEPFVPFLDEIVERLAGLIEEVSGTDTKLALLNTLSSIVERVEKHILPYSHRIVGLLPPLWEQSGEEHLLKQAILTLLTRLLTSLGQESQQFHGSFHQLIRFSMDPSSDAHLYLLEEALDLWHALVQCTPAPAPEELLSLIILTLPILDTATPNLRKALEILESYVLLAPKPVLEGEFPAQLFPMLAAPIGPGLHTDVVGQITSLVEMMIMASENASGQQGLVALAKVIVESGFFKNILNEIRKNWQSNQSKNPPLIDTFVETDYLNVLSRLILAGPNLFIAMLESVAIASDSEPVESLEDKMSWLLTEWFENFENMSSPQHRKLQCLALTKLLETGQPWILRKMQDLLAVWTDVLTEIQESDGTDLVVFPSQQNTSQITEEAGTITPDTIRKREFNLLDPVWMMDTRTFIMGIFQSTITNCGGEAAFQGSWLASVDKTVFESFRALVSQSPGNKKQDDESMG